jgi:WD40 repeat protein
MNLSKEKRTNELLFVTFNQDYGCFACATEKGFCIYNCDPLKERFKRDFENGGIGMVEMLFRCNILALVGGNLNPKYPPNKVMIWDDFQNKCIAELEFRSEVKAVKLRRDRIVVVLENKVYVYNFADLQLLHQIETCYNSRGLCALSPSSSTVLAVPGIKPGTVHLELYDLKQTQQIQAHNNALTQICLTLDGARLATASEKGTLIRIFDTKTGNQLRELRRGADKAEIYSIAFSPDSNWLCVSSDKGTVHIYGIAQENNKKISEKTKKIEEEKAKTRHSSLSFMKEILPSYFSSEWSFASFKISETRSICCFSSDSSSVIG